MRIAYIGQKGIPASFGGVERYTQEVAVRMAKMGHEVFVYARKNYTDPSLKTFKGVRIINLPSIPTKSLDAISHTLLATVHALFQRYDIIHYHSIGPTSLSFIPRIFSRKTKIVATYQCRDYFHQKWGWIARAYLRFGEFVTCKVPHMTFTVTPLLAKYIKEKFGREAVIIPNGMSVTAASEENFLKKRGLEKGRYILSVSRLIRHKGIHHLINAYQKLYDNGQTEGMKLVIAGDGFYTDDYVKELRAMAEKNKDIILTGNITGEELRQVFSHAYIFVQPSESEGLSLALLEAMGYERPIVVSNIPENIIAIHDTGLMFLNGNDRDLAHKLLLLIRHPDLARDFGQRARQRAEQHFDWGIIAGKINAAYGTLANEQSDKQDFQKVFDRRED